MKDDTKNYNCSNQLPKQRLTEAQKKKEYGSIEKWGEAVIEAMFGPADLRLTSEAAYMSRKQANYDLLAGEIDISDFKSIIDPYNVDGTKQFKLPANFKHYDRITPSIELLKGEEIKRPFNARVVVTNPEIVTKIEEDKKNIFIQSLIADLHAEMQAKGIDVKPEEGVQDLPPNIQQYLETSYRDIREIMGNDSLEFLIKYTHALDKFMEGIGDLMAVNEEIYWVGNISNEPTFRNVNPVYFDCHKGPDVKYIEDAEWARETRYLTLSQILDEFYDVLTEEEIDELEEGENSTGLVVDSGMRARIRYTSGNDYNEGVSYNSNGKLYRVDYVAWKALRKLGTLKYADEMGIEQEQLVDEYFKPVKELGQTVEWFWIAESWEGTRIGSTLFKNIRPLANQIKSLDNPSIAKLPFVGVVNKQKNSGFYSLVDKAKPLNYLYDVIMFRLELELARAKGKKMLMDIAQIPKSQGFDMDRWLYYFDALGIAFINSFEEGTGKFAGQKTNFNAFTQIDLSLSQVINQYIMLLDKIENMIGDIIGVTKQRLGAVSSSEAVGNVERTIIQSSHITEPLFFTHGEVKRRVLERLIEVSKLAWIEGKKSAYVTSEGSRKMLSLDSIQYAECEYGLFVSNSSKDNKIIDKISQLAEAGLQGGKTNFSDIVSILENESIAHAKKVLKEAEAEARQIAEKSQEIQKQIAESNNQTTIKLTEMKYQHESEMNIRDNETKLAIAGMTTEGVMASVMEKANTNDRKISNEMQKLGLENGQKKEEMNQNKQIEDAKNRIKEKEIEAKKVIARQKKPTAK